jgi:hypothetical protein
MEGGKMAKVLISDIERKFAKEMEVELKEFEVSEEARHAIEKSGLSLPTRTPLPDNSCEMPADITEIGYQELGTLHGNVVNMGCFVRVLTALSDIEREEAEASYDYIKSRAMEMLADPGEDKVTFTKAKVASHPLVKSCQHKLLVARAKHTLYQRKLENYDAVAIAISREITRRNNEMLQVAKGG